MSNYSILFFHFESAWEERNCVFLAILTIGRDMESANCIPGLAYMRWFVVEESLQYQVIQSRWIPFSGWQHNTFFACQLRHQLGCGMSHWWCVAIIKWKWQQEVEQFLFNRQEPDFEVDRATATDQPLDMWLYAVVFHHRFFKAVPLAPKKERCPQIPFTGLQRTRIMWSPLMSRVPNKLKTVHNNTNFAQRDRKGT